MIESDVETVPGPYSRPQSSGFLEVNNYLSSRDSIGKISSNTISVPNPLSQPPPISLRGKKERLIPEQPKEHESLNPSPMDDVNILSIDSNQETGFEEEHKCLPPYLKSVLPSKNVEGCSDREFVVLRDAAISQTVQAIKLLFHSFLPGSALTPQEALGIVLKSCHNRDSINFKDFTMKDDFDDIRATG